jgi:hypothetical protein
MRHRTRDISGAGWYAASSISQPHGWLRTRHHSGILAPQIIRDVWFTTCMQAPTKEQSTLRLDVSAAARAGANSQTVRVSDPPELFP